MNSNTGRLTNNGMMAREAKTSAIKMNFFKLFRVYSNSLEMTNVSEFP